MSLETTDVIGVKCANCKKVRGKYCNPWVVCEDCGKALCYICSPSYWAPKCSKCHKKDYIKEEKIYKNTPIECSICHKKKLPRYMGYSYMDKVDICKVCAKREEEDKRKAEEKQRKKNAKDGLVEVIYGEHPVPKKDGGHGYAYYFSEPLKLGDIVQVPKTWLSRFKGESINIATVVSTYSDYDGLPSSIVRVIDRARVTELLEFVRNY